MPRNCSVGGSLGVPGVPRGCGGFGAVTASLLGTSRAEEAGLGALPRKPASCEQDPSSDAHLASLDLGFSHHRWNSTRAHTTILPGVW